MLLSSKVAPGVSMRIFQFLALAAAGLLLPSSSNSAEPTRTEPTGAPIILPNPAPPSIEAVRSDGGATAIPPTGRAIVLEVSKGTLLRMPRPVATVFIANPDVADVQVKSPSMIYLNAKAPGETVIYAVDAEDRVMLNAPVRVQHDLSRLRQSL